MKQFILGCLVWAASAAPLAARTITLSPVGNDPVKTTAAVNAAITLASRNHGDTVAFAPGRYPCYSIRLQSHVTLRIDRGAIIEAARPEGGYGYDPAEDNAYTDYQDFGHSHWHNSLMWGEGLTDVTIMGGGRMVGTHLSRGLSRMDSREGNKAIALRECSNVRIDGIEMLQCGHFAILATGVNHLTLTNLRIDTNRDGIDIDGCHDVYVAHCEVNTPWDDAIVLKASYALGRVVDCEHVTVERCKVSGYDCGTLLDGTRQLTGPTAPDRGGRTGRIKLGTESTGGYRHITIRDCEFEWCRGLALETVDGGVLENVLVERIRMNHIVNAAIFLRLGSRMRSPKHVEMGKLQNVVIRDVKAYDVDSRYSSIIAGVPGHRIQNVVFDDIEIHYRGGCVSTDKPTAITRAPWERPGYREPRNAEETAQRKAEINKWNATERDTALVVNLSQPVPEVEGGYPEPWMFGVVPAKGFFVRHAENIVFNRLRMSWERPDVRPEWVKDDCHNITVTP